jgi:hypothetical protein
MRIAAVTAVLVLTAGAALADGTIDQKTQVHFGGAIGGLINTFGGKATREGVVSTSVVKGNRKLTRHDENGELVDLDAEKVYNIDYDRKTYTATTFAELRRKWEEQQERARKEQSRASRQEAQQGPEWEVDFNIKSTGARETINGFATHQEVATVTVHEKGKTLEQSGGFVLTSDMWMGPRVAAMRELADFDRRFMSKVYGPAFDAEMLKMGALMATTPAFGKAMKTFSEHKGQFDGTPIRTTLTFETVAGPASQSAESQNEQTPSSVSSAVFGGIMKKVKERQASKAQTASGPERSSLMESTTEITHASATAASDDVSLPAGFRQK